MAGVILGSVDGLLCSEESALSNRVFTRWLVGLAVYADTMRNLHLQKLDLRLLYSQVCHFDVKAVELNTTHTFLHILGESCLANPINHTIVG